MSSKKLQRDIQDLIIKYCNKNYSSMVSIESKEEYLREESGVYDLNLSFKIDVYIPRGVTAINSLIKEQKTIIKSIV